MTIDETILTRIEVKRTLGRNERLSISPHFVSFSLIFEGAFGLVGQGARKKTILQTVITVFRAERFSEDGKAKTNNPFLSIIFIFL